MTLRLPTTLIIEMAIGPATWGFRPVKDAPVPIQGADQFGLQVGQRVLVANYPKIVNDPQYAPYNTVEYTKDGGCRIVGLRLTEAPLKNPLPASASWGWSSQMTPEEWAALKMVDPYNQQWWVRWNDLVPVAAEEETMSNVMGMDVSTWQDEASTPQHVDFGKAYANGMRFVFVKASQATYQDADLTWNWKPAKAAGLLRGAYHFYDWSQSPLAQANFFYNTLGGDLGELPPVLDYEMRTGIPARATAVSYIKQFIERVAYLFGRLPLMYTSFGMWSAYGSADPYWLKYPLWIANYGVTTPKVPLPWTGWKFWQYSSTGDGKYYGMESQYLDMNWWNGTLAELYTWAGYSPPVPLTLEQKVDRLWQAHPELW